MTEDQTSTVDQLILDHLDRANLPDTAENLIIAALCGADHLADMLGGTAPQRPRPPVAATDDRQPIGTYLAGIEVTGFRGIGPTATLHLVPGPGLTIVTGRNGSGKSSFAEAAEFALTGDNKRWSGRTSVWRQGWRNLHADTDPRIRVRLGVEGHRDGATVECHWTGDANLTEATTFLQATGQRRQNITDLGWDTPLQLYRPFLSYSELGGLVSGSPSEMHDSLQRILGLGRLVEIETMLKTARRDLDQQRKRGTETLPALRTTLAEHPDPRARLAEQALTGRTADLDQLDTLTTSSDTADDATVVPLRQLDVLHLPDRDALTTTIEALRAALHQIDDLAGTPVEEAKALAGLLRDALRHHASHPDQPCPVCGGRTLDEDWAAQAHTHLHQLTRRAEHLDAAHRAERQARRALRQQVPALPAVLHLDLSSESVHTDDARTAWQRWDDLLATADPHTIAASATTIVDALRDTLTPVQTAARQALHRRRQAWQPVADQLRTWIDTERASRHAAVMYAAVKTAIAELRTIGEKIRDDKLAPVAAEATTIWNTLRHDSNVQLGTIKLAGTGPTRRVDLGVQVDGVPGAALSVMSQGELHSLALALFLPRATMPDSPFRFLLIDDPVQSMDPAKVYGLAQVLAQVAKHRQVIVFTHDDRLPAAVRHLQLDARILAVSRLTRSQVTVTGGRDGDPAQRYLNDAAAITQDEKLADTLRVTVVCNLIRDALEFTCHERIRVQGFRAGTSVTETEAAISEAQGLRPTLALALLGDRKRVADLTAELTRIDSAAPWVVRAANSGSHGGATNLTTLVDDARRLVRKLSPT
ncbi:AAA family ATPase [Micromonospora echinofusca]|uniref:Nuclease SbcCD subunit C n=1 Tax=Micromonospora echinofusca TaxID=47858 RepID=A0ABS3W161_MICEH|nr:AAA family ATPase [Micromonospora echinofusca]MBO4210527.1 AAA family ATPase [Micromonospora echinofusca]